ncbi:H-2 class I histocompatibility antigen, Q10 alpha chain-like isoform X2 [Colossoma macropomum]|uniref:H-2 class I histocompatibility antigen, Q10 alpha chain-like isoform X2 n=1 Tax=Colossoma macropomum TaxID=42526 RepID=UPI001864095C|nr:H-2 class I histocompatibility antigen, Q10 alpha chain-like isoform X2 [Colossoma macropomum]
MDYYTVMKKSLFILIVYIHLTSAVSHSLSYFYTGVTPGIHFPEFTAVGLLDGQQIVYYDSNIRRLIPKTDWMEKSVDEDYWNIETLKHLANQEAFEVNLATAMMRFNQTEGVHTVQWMYGCELHDVGTKTGYMKYGYDGEDFISLDLNTETWTAAHPKAVITKRKWEKTDHYTKFQRAYLENECIAWLQKFVGYGRSSLERKVCPEASLFQKDSSSPVVCHATGFFPKAVMISWQKNGEDLHEDMELRETLPNQDGTFQKRSVLTVSPEELNRNEYTCVILHSSLEKKMVLQVSERRVLQGFKHVSRSPSSGCESEGSSSTISITSSE